MIAGKNDNLLYASLKSFVRTMKNKCSQKNLKDVLKEENNVDINCHSLGRSGEKKLKRRVIHNSIISPSFYTTYAIHNVSSSSYKLL